MNHLQRRQAFGVLGVLVLGLVAPAPSWAQSSDDEIRQTVARISYLAGSVSYARGDDPEDWQAADFNVPMTIGDRLYTGKDGRVELQVSGGFYIHIGAQADLAALNLTDDTKQWSLRSGAAAFQLRRLGPDEVFEVDTPNAAITFERAGEYRVDVDADGFTRVAVLRGRALVAAGGGQVPLNAGDEMDIEGIDSPRYDVVKMREPDAFDRWVRDRERRFETVRSSQYVHADIVGAADLDEHGRWQTIPSYGWVWTPTAVESDWQPYRTGHWIWQDPWGWTWVAAEPWGWAPYHYGRWVNYSSRWWWVPVARTERAAFYAPALVAFAGGGPSGSEGFIGWFPLAPRDPFVHWWGTRARASNVTNVTYINRTYITVVNQNTFVSGSVVTNNYVRDRNVMTTVMRAPVLSGPLPIVPTSASLRVAVRPGLPAPPRPPEVVATRTVVVRAAPPPPPPTFQAKVVVIERNNGAPIGPAAATRMAEIDRTAARPVVATRPVAAPEGRVTLAPKSDTARLPRPEPVAPARGRPLAGSAGAPLPPSAQATPVGRPASGQAPAGQPPTDERGRRSFETPAPAARPTAVPKPPAGQPPTDERGRPRSFETPAPGPQPTPLPRPPAGQPSTVERGRRSFETPAPAAQPTAVPKPPAGQPPTVERGRRSFETPAPTAQPTAVPKPPAGQPPTVERREPERGRASVSPPPPQAAPDSQKEKPKEKGKEKEKEKPKDKDKDKDKDKEKPTPTPRPS